MPAATKWIRLFFLTLFLGFAGFGLAACDQGPMEEAGENVDDTFDEAEDELD